MDKELRKNIKALTLGLSYGASTTKMAEDNMRKVAEIMKRTEDEFIMKTLRAKEIKEANDNLINSLGT